MRYATIALLLLAAGCPEPKIAEEASTKEPVTDTKSDAKETTGDYKAKTKSAARVDEKKAN